MSLYPQAAAGQDLYDVSDVPKAKLGTEMSFQTPYGIVSARYMQHVGAATQAAGYGVGFAGSGYGFNTAQLNNASAEMQFFAGIAVGAYTVATGYYGWVVYRGPVTNIQLGATYASSAAIRSLALNSGGQYVSTVSTAATDNHLAAIRVHAILRAVTAAVTSNLNTNAVADIYWR